MARILIAGATSAIATEVARRYAERGDRLFLVARNEVQLAKIRAELGPAVAGSRVADFAETERACEVVEAAIEALGELDVAVIAHGLLGDQLATEHDWNAAKEVLDINFASVVALLVPLANHFEARGAGDIAVLSSVAGERGRPRNYTYGAAKGALTIYLQGLQSRLWRRGVGVHTIKLGPVDTPMTATHAKNLLFATAPSVARTIVEKIDGPSGAAYVPWFWSPIMRVVRVLPESIFQRISFLSGR